MTDIKSGSNLEKLLKTGKFVVTAELGPPRGADRSAIEKKCEILKGYGDAFNITDCQTAVVRRKESHERPVWRFTKWKV